MCMNDNISTKSTEINCKKEPIETRTIDLIKSEILSQITQYFINHPTSHAIEKYLNEHPKSSTHIDTDEIEYIQNSLLTLTMNIAKAQRNFAQG